MFKLKRIIPLSLIAAFVLSTTVVYAEGTTPSTTAKGSAYAQEIKTTRETIQANRDANKQIREAIAQKWEELRTTIKTMRENKTLKDKKDDVEAKRQEIKAEQAQLKASREDLQSKWAEVKNARTNKDFEKVSNTLKEIPPMQQTKKGILQRISDSLASFIGALKN